MAVESAWNSGDTLAVQANWSRKLDPNVIGAQASLAQATEAGGLLTVYTARQVAPRIVAADVTLDDSREIWVWIECRETRANGVTGDAEGEARSALPSRARDWTSPPQRSASA